MLGSPASSGVCVCAPWRGALGCGGEPARVRGAAVRFSEQGAAFWVDKPNLLLLSSPISAWAGEGACAGGAWASPIRAAGGRASWEREG